MGDAKNGKREQGKPSSSGDLEKRSYYNHNDDDDDDSNENKQLSDNAFVNAGLEAISGGKILNKAGLKRPTEIQKLATPELIEGNSAVILAETGSGKTFAYTLPLMSQVAAPGRGGTKVSGKMLSGDGHHRPKRRVGETSLEMAELCSIWCQRTDLELPAPTVFSIFGKEKKLLKPTSLKQRKNTNNRNRKYVASKSSTTKSWKEREQNHWRFRRSHTRISTSGRFDIYASSLISFGERRVGIVWSSQTFCGGRV